MLLSPRFFRARQGLTCGTYRRPAFGWDAITVTGGLCLLLVFIVYATCSDLINVSGCTIDKHSTCLEGMSIPPHLRRNRERTLRGQHDSGTHKQCTDMPSYRTQQRHGNIAETLQQSHTILNKLHPPMTSNGTEAIWHANSLKRRGMLSSFLANVSTLKLHHSEIYLATLRQ